MSSAPAPSAASPGDLEGPAATGEGGADFARERSSLLLTALDLGVDLNVDQGRLDGTARLTLSNVGTSPVEAVPLLLGRLLQVSRAEDDTGSRLELEQEVRVFQDEPMLQVTRAILRLGRAIPPGASATVGVRYSGALVGYTEVGWLYVRDRISPEFTILREDAFAFPVLGVLSLAANRRAPRGPFAFRLEVTAPRALLVATGGERVGRVEHGDTATTTYRSREPVPFLNIALAPYRVQRDGGVQVFHFTADEAGASALLSAARRAMELLTEWLGPLGREPALTVIEIPEGFGSQASLAAGILQTADAFRRTDARHELYHELSHLWNAPDRDAPSPRWNEGLGRFLEWRLASAVDGGVELDALAEKTAGDLLGRCRKEPRCASVPLVRYGEAGMTDWSYRVGHLFFHIVYRLAGPAAFDAALGGHFQAHRESGGTTSELLDRIRQLSPAAGAAIEDWVTTARWHSRLQAGESVAAILESYRSQAAPSKRPSQIGVGPRSGLAEQEEQPTRERRAPRARRTATPFVSRPNCVHGA